jgi:sugar lactone lactonase YvrE
LMSDSGTGIPGIIGVNGIKILGNVLYFTDSAQTVLAKIHINPDGTRAGPTVVLASTPGGGWYDDFVLDPAGNAFLTTAVGNTIVELKGGNQEVTAGNLNSTEIAQATAVAFGRTFIDSDILYVTTTGGLVNPIDGSEIIGGQLVAVDLKNRY